MPGGSWRSGESSYTARTDGRSDPDQQFSRRTSSGLGVEREGSALQVLREVKAGSPGSPDQRDDRQRGRNGVCHDNQQRARTRLQIVGWCRVIG